VRVFPHSKADANVLDAEETPARLTQSKQVLPNRSFEPHMSSIHSSPDSSWTAVETSRGQIGRVVSNAWILIAFRTGTHADSHAMSVINKICSALVLQKHSACSPDVLCQDVKSLGRASGCPAFPYDWFLSITARFFGTRDRLGD
jgi:hypothetical protein